MIIQLLDGTQINIADYSLKRLSHRIPSLGANHSTASIDGRNGVLFLESLFNERIITVDFLYKVNDIHEFYELRYKVNALFARTEPYYLIFKNEPQKRWLVRLNSNFELPPDPQIETFTVQFVCENVFAESIYTTLEMEHRKELGLNPLGGDDYYVGFDEFAYTFTDDKFNVKNLGNIVVDPREHELVIWIQGDFPNGFTVTNQTTGEIYEYHGSLLSDDILIIDGIRTLKNDLSDFANTNKKLITLNIGDNHMQIEGGTLSSISFNFRFLYK